VRPCAESKIFSSIRWRLVTSRFVRTVPRRLYWSDSTMSRGCLNFYNLDAPVVRDQKRLQIPRSAFQTLSRTQIGRLIVKNPPGLTGGLAHTFQAAML
jgi:hypothetical protein